jgi:hypothetical protein
MLIISSVIAYIAIVINLVTDMCIIYCLVVFYVHYLSVYFLLYSTHLLAIN